MSHFKSILLFIVFAVFQFLPIQSPAHHSPQLVTFFIHGINSDPEAFCDFPEVLKNQINTELRNNRAIHTTTLEYDSKGNELGNTRDFAVDIAAQIAVYYRDNNIPLSVPYAFVMHSQGGLVGKKFIQKCLVENNCEKDSGYKVPQGALPQNLKHYITVGTPHHGSSGASLLIRGLKLFGLEILGNAFFLKRLGNEEQNASLNPGSVSFIEDRLFTIDNQAALKRRTTFHNIIGAKDYNDFSFYSKLSLGRELESDMVVSTTSARQDFNYCVKEDVDTPLKCGTTSLVDPDNVHLIGLQHSPLPIQKNDQDMKCVENGVPHPTLDIVRKILLTKFYGRNADSSNVSKAPKLSHALKNFAVDIHLYFPEELQRGPVENSLEIAFRGSDFLDLSSYLIKGGLAHQYKGHNNHDFEWTATTLHRNSLSYFHIGKIEQADQWALFTRGVLRSDFDETERKHMYQIRYPGFKAVRFEVPVSAGMTSYVKVYMTPDTEGASSSQLADIVDTNTNNNIAGLQTHPIGNFGLKFNLEAFYSRSTLKNHFKQYRNLNSCYLGVIAPTFVHGQAVEPARYESFSSPSKTPSNLIDVSVRSNQRMLDNYQKRRERLVRIHGAFRNGDKHRYLVSKHYFLQGYKAFWIDAKDVDILPQEFIDSEFGDNPPNIHQQDVCK